MCIRDRDNNDIAPFKNILNEMYSKDISKKVHSSYLLKAQKGQFTGCLAPFGYRKDPEDKNHLLIDEETAPIVRLIFGYALNGHGPNYIRRRLEEEKIPCPTWWNRERGLRNTRTKWEKKDPENGRYMWDLSLIHILLFCADCGSVMYQQRYQTDKRKQDCYICGNYKKRTHDCTAHFIRTDLLTAGVLSNLRKVTSYAAKHEKQFIKLLIEQNEDGGKRRNAAKRKELDAAEKRISELSAIFKRLYEDVYKRQRIGRLDGDMDGLATQPGGVFR